MLPKLVRHGPWHNNNYCRSEATYYLFEEVSDASAYDGLGGGLLLAGAVRTRGNWTVSSQVRARATAPTTDKNAHPSTNALIPGQEGMEKSMASELDQESPTRAYRGWRGGYHGGGYRGYYGGYRWDGYYGYRPWGYYGWRRPWYWGVPYVSLGIGYPYYYAYPYSSTFSYGAINNPYGAYYSY